MTKKYRITPGRSEYGSAVWHIQRKDGIFWYTLGEYYLSFESATDDLRRVVERDKKLDIHKKKSAVYYDENGNAI